MNNKNHQIAIDILYNENDLDRINAVKKLTSKEILHIIADEYNWDDGFDIPFTIMENSECDLGTALLLFERAEGYRIFTEPKSVERYPNVEWRNFIFRLYSKITDNEFSTKSIQHTPSFSKVAMYKLKKIKPDISNVFLIGNKV